MFHHPARTQGQFSPENVGKEGAGASQAIEIQKERQHLNTQRAEMQRQRAREDQQCFQQFSVNNCRMEVRTRYRAVLMDLQRRERLLNDMERKSKGLQRLQQLDEKALRAAPHQSEPHQTSSAQAHAERVRPATRTPATATDRERSSPSASVTPNHGELAVQWSIRQNEAMERRQKAAERQMKRKSAPLPPGH